MKIMRIQRIAFACACLLVIQLALLQPPGANANTQQTNVTAARQARDSASVEELQKIIANTRKEATESNSLDAYLRLALFQTWLCEAAEARQNKALIKQAATEGVASAEKAVALDPKSSEAHRLLGDLLGRLIPHVFGGGMRYGKRAADEMDKAIELDPKNPEAYVPRAISYFFTPRAFGGSRDKAFELLRKAVELDPAGDTPHVWMAIFLLEMDQEKEALAEILRAREINPNRAFTKTVYEQVTQANKA